MVRALKVPMLVKQWCLCGLQLVFLRRQAGVLLK